MSEHNYAPFAIDIMRRTGLDLIPVNDRWVEENQYWVLSPKGIRLFRVGSFGDGSKIGMVSTPEMYNLQFGKEEE